MSGIAYLDLHSVGIDSVAGVLLALRGSCYPYIAHYFNAELVANRRQPIN